MERGLLFDVLGVPLELRDGHRRVPEGSNGPALAALIAKELARHEANLVSTLNQRDRDDQLQATRSPSTYVDATRKQLRSDNARALKRLVWAKNTFDELRSGVAASAIIDPRTRRPLDPDVEDAPAPKRAAAAAPPPPPPPYVEPAEEPSAAPGPNRPSVAEGCSDEREESRMLFAEALSRMMAEARKAAQPEPQPPL